MLRLQSPAGSGFKRFLCFNSPQRVLVTHERLCFATGARKCRRVNSGSRAGQRLVLGPKALFYFEGQTLLERAVASVAPLAAQVIVGVRQAASTVARRLLGSEAFRNSLGTDSTCIQLMIGGATRQETILRLVQCATKPFTLLHEVARPFVSHAHLSSLLQNVAQTGAVASCVPVEARDAVAIYEGPTLPQALPRNRWIAVQAQQAYKTAVLVDAYRRAASADPDHVPDATPGVVVAAGYEVRLIEGDTANIKLTYAQDAVLLQNHRTCSALDFVHATQKAAATQNCCGLSFLRVLVSFRNAGPERH